MHLSWLAYGQFGPSIPISPELHDPSCIVGADVDGDGDQDLVFAAEYGHKVGWFENLDGLGSFSQAKIISDTTFYAKSVDVADIDGDGDMDIVASSQQSVYWFENVDGQGGFWVGKKVSTQNLNSARDVHAVDLDGDGDPDLLVASYLLNAIFWYENLDGLGTFGSEITLTTSLINAQAISSGDMDGDGDPDILASGAGDQLVWFRNEDGQGMFSAMLTVDNTLDFPTDIQTADFDGDGDLDILVAGRYANQVVWYQNLDGSGNFSGKKVIESNFTSVNGIYAADFDGDGDMDAAAAAIFAGGVHWYENTNGQGLFAIHPITDELNGANAVCAVDVNGSGAPDLFYSSNLRNEIGWFENGGSGNFAAGNVMSYSLRSPEFMEAGDLDGDGDTDILVTSFAADQIVWFENLDGIGHFSDEQIILDNVDGARGGMLTDLDGDGKPDILAGSAHDDQLFWMKNLGGGANFGPPILIDNNADGLIGVFPAFINSDAFLDVVSVSLANDKIAWYANDGTGGFGSAQIISNSYEEPSGLHYADIDNDGDTDLVIAANANDEIIWFENLDGEGNFSSGEVIANDMGHQQFVHTGDLNTDGFPDILTFDEWQLVWLENQGGTGTFSAPKVVTPGFFFGHPRAVPTDIDGDGDLDILPSRFATNKQLYWYENTDGQGNFTVHQIATTLVETPYFLGLADLDGNGSKDLFFSDNADQIAWCRNYFGGPNLHGEVFLDANQNGVKDSMEIHLLQQNVSVQPNGLDFWTTQDGRYFFAVSEGDYTLGCSPSEGWSFATDSAFEVSITDTTTWFYFPFGLVPDGEYINGQLGITAAPMRCNDIVPLWIQCGNQSNQTITQGWIRLELDTLLIYVSAIPQPDSVANQQIFWSFDTLHPTYGQSYQLFVQTPAEDLTGSEVTLSGHMAFLDETGDLLFQTADTLVSVITCAFDPNDKLVHPGSQDSAHLTLMGDTLLYTIRFQNTGNDVAFDVVIRDTLDADLDPLTFRFLGSSHAEFLVTTLKNEAFLTFRFQDIMLPDSTTDYYGSMGYVQYRILPKANLPEGTLIANTASIYFDRNAPIVTNTTENILVSELPSGAKEKALEDRIWVFPNPSRDLFQVQTDLSQPIDIALFDAYGRQLKAGVLQNSAEINLEGNPAGIYFLVVRLRDDIRVLKLVKN